MRPSEAMRLFQASGAWKEGHFVLSSGLHSHEYLQCGAVLQQPSLASRLCGSLAERFVGDDVTCVVSPALGGIIAGYEVARHLGARALFAERQENLLKFRRGFRVEAADRVLVVEDVVTTGGSVEELINVVRDWGAQVIGVGALVDRSGGWASFDVKYHALLSLRLKTFSPGDCPLCKEGVPLTKPGSRGL